MGYKIRFSSKPVQNKLPNQNCLKAINESLLEDATVNLLELGAIEKVPARKDQFVSSYFLVK